MMSLDDAVLKFYGDDFPKHLSQCEQHSLLSERQLHIEKQSMYNYLEAVGRAIES